MDNQILCNKRTIILRKTKQIMKIVSKLKAAKQIAKFLSKAGRREYDLKQSQKQSTNGGRAGKLLNQQQQQQQQQLLQQNIHQQININSQQQQQKQIYLNQQRPISVGNMGGMKKRNKNKAIMQELLLQCGIGLNSKQKILQGAPLVGFMGNHNLSVKITNIAGKVNAIRPQQFFEDDIKNINNTNSGYIKGVNGGGGLENFLPNSKVNNHIGYGGLGQNEFNSFDIRRKSQPQ